MENDLSYDDMMRDAGRDLFPAVPSDIVDSFEDELAAPVCARLEA